MEIGEIFRGSFERGLLGYKVLVRSFGGGFLVEVGGEKELRVVSVECMMSWWRECKIAEQTMDLPPGGWTDPETQRCLDSSIYDA